VTIWQLFVDRLTYGVATTSRLLEMIGLFCKRALQKRPIFSKETCNFKEPTNRSRPIMLSHIAREVGGWGRDPKKCTGRDWGMGSSTI